MICGSLRKGSYNAALARALPGLAPAGLSLRPAPSFEKIPLYNFDIQNSTGFPAEVNAWADAIRSADALIIVSPEYNWSIPGALKNAIDWASRPFPDNVLRGKPVAVMGASTGLFGAVWAQAELRKVLRHTGADVLDAELPVGLADQGFTPHGELADPELRLRLADLLEALGNVREADERVQHRDGTPALRAV